MTAPFVIPSAADIGPIPVRGPMTDGARSTAMSHILAECYGNYKAGVAVGVTHRLGYTITDIGAKYFFAALDEAQAQKVTP